MLPVFLCFLCLAGLAPGLETKRCPKEQVRSAILTGYNSSGGLVGVWVVDDPCRILAAMLRAWAVPAVAEVGAQFVTA